MISSPSLPRKKKRDVNCSYLKMVQAVTTRYNGKIKSATSHFCDYFNVSNFWYNKISNSGFLSTISNHAAWTEHVGAEELFFNNPFLRHPSCIREGIRILNDFNADSDSPLMEILLIGKRKYNLNVWMTLVNKTEDGLEEFGFSSARTNVSFLLNELPLIKLFTKKFREENGFLFLRLEENQVNLVDLLGPTFYENVESETRRSAAKRAFLQQLGIQIENPLSSREVEVLKFLLQGYSASQIGDQIHLSKRTVEHYLERTKEKFLCQGKAELVQKARELELYGYL